MSYAWPVPGYKMSTAYGIKGSYWKACGFHTGIDIAAPAGTEIVAPEDGDIRSRNYGSSFGSKQFALSPDHDGEWFFAHVSWRLPTGTRVSKGQVIARVGSEGNATGPHLHLEWHPVKMNWSCGNMADPMAKLSEADASPDWMFPAGHKVYQKYLRVDGHELNQDRESDSIKALQEVLNRHSMPGGHNMPVTGKYWTATDNEVRLCQSLHLPPEDPEMRSYVGPGQWRHLAEATGCPYVWVPGDNSTPITPPPAPPPEVPWFVPPSIRGLLHEVDDRWPGRDKSSDGTIGDYQHSQSQSEHNPVGHKYGPKNGTPGAVHAVDITYDPAHPDMKAALWEALVGDDRVWYVIHDGKIVSRTYDWAVRDYTGSNPHTTHFHMSLRDETPDKALFAENNTAPWLTGPGPEPEPEPPPMDNEVIIAEIKRLLDLLRCD